MKHLRFAFGSLVILVAAVACSGGGKMGPTASAPLLLTPKSVSPGLVKPAPMAKTALLPSSAMVSPRRTLVDIQGLNWTQIPGSASQVSASTDGSIWALSTEPAGPDKYIWHYVAGTWTNIPGLASELAIAPNGTLYAINSGGGTYAYSAGVWTALGGGASGLTAAADGSTYVLSNGSGPDQAIWHNVNGVWSQVPGSGTQIAASWDTGSYTLSSGSVSPGGLFILNSLGGIYYENTAGSFSTLPGNASAVAPTTGGGVFVLAYPTNSAGNTIYYYNYSPPGWTAESGSGVSIATDGAHLYVVAASGAIYSSPVTPTATPTPSLPAQTAAVGGAQAWVASSGFTLYEFAADGNLVSNCTISTYNGCSGVWPLLLAPAGSTTSGDFTAFTRSDGKLQWAYFGHPLYTYSGDAGPYQTNGDGLVEPDGKTWSIARPAGVTPPPTPTPPPSPVPGATDKPCLGYYC